jgi:hypothetical protein
MADRRTDPSKPGQSSANDCHYDPHGNFGAIGSGNHAGNGREDSGSFKSMSRGGSSEWGDDYVKKYKPGGRSAGSSDVPRGSELNDDGDGYASDSDDKY